MMPTTNRPFHLARAFVHTLGLKGERNWRVYAKSGQKPVDIPSHPETAYPKEWNGWGDWLGTGRMARRQKRYLSFPEARQYVHTLKIASSHASRYVWEKYWKTHKRPANIPCHPDRVYRREWSGWPDWLGIGDAQEESNKEMSKHTSIEYTLLLLGHLLGYETYTPDKRKVSNGKRLVEILNKVDLPRRFPESIQQQVSKIDVIWVRQGKSYAHCWEVVDRSKNFEDSLTRLLHFEDMDASLYIASPRARHVQFSKDLEKPSYYAIRSKVHFVPFDELDNYHVYVEALLPFIDKILNHSR
jgi:hypothetical protein